MPNDDLPEPQSRMEQLLDRLIREQWETNRLLSVIAQRMPAYRLVPVDE